jgi:cysteine-rich repeat protein
MAGACGDGVLQQNEICDDGNGDNTDACAGCQTASCGDGFVWANNEDCDDANNLDTDACIDCSAAACGDGFVQQGVEDCDDANGINTDACVACSPADCGDGFVQQGAEQCDDGNGVDNDNCGNDCMTNSPFVQCYSSSFGVSIGNPWVICAISQNSAWVSANTGGTYNAVQICNHIGFANVAQYGGTCGNVCGYCQGATSCQAPGAMTFDMGGGPLPNLSTTVHWRCSN